MALDRRRFLELMGLTASAVAAGSIPALWISEDLYVNRRLGLRLKKPPGWEFLNVRELRALRDEQELACVDKRFEAELKEAVGLPLVSFGPIGRRNDVGPFVHVWLEHISASDRPAVEAHTDTYGRFYQSVLRNLRFEVVPHSVDFLGHAGSMCTIRFDYESSAGKSAPARVKSLLFPRGSLGYTFNMADDAEQGWTKRVRGEFEFAIDSVRFVERVEGLT